MKTLKTIKTVPYNWKSALGGTLLSLSLALSAIPAVALADGNPVQVVAIAGQAVEAATYPLTESIQANIKSMSISKSGNVTSIGAVVRLQNQTTLLKRVPDYEIRVKTSDGSEYKLTTSAANPKSMLAMEKVELTGMVTLDRPGDVTVTDVSFVEVDEYVYPKAETYVLTIPVTNVWNSAKPDITDPAFVKAWGDTFTIPESPSPIRFTPSSLTKQTDDKGAHIQVITLLAENPGTAGEALPEFRLDGKAGELLYTGKPADSNPLTLAAGDQKYIQYIIPTDQDIDLQSLLLMTKETFVVAGAAAGAAGSAASAGQSTNPTFDMGLLKIGVPTAVSSPVQLLPAYAMGTTIPVDPLNRLLDLGTQVSLMELHMHENPGSGFKSVVAKFRLQNTSGETVTLPEFQTELIGSDGASYSGTRQSAVAAELMPHLGYVVSYSYMVPASEKGDSLGMKLLDSKTTAPYSTTIGGFQTAVQAVVEDSELMSFYPFDVKLNDWTMSAYTNAGIPVTYSYKLKLNLTVERVEDVVVDANFSKFTIELVDGLGRTLGSQSVPFSGNDMLISGEQTIQINNIKTEQQEYPLTIKLYETITTPNGEAKRLVKTLQQ
ncbi:hypothetical protein [Paenibacillus agricola]|uniref:Uncharacterized protein n=1 Tax=Paenibacillus agricola TaxID=2716264 RepID=A0ABX0J306_9BACL|nr:hypothetical protein [Paenibacillus agricola]NHN29791.1 hypothetical protein [Paenibacillus agricola]